MMITNTWQAASERFNFASQSKVSEKLNKANPWQAASERRAAWGEDLNTSPSTSERLNKADYHTLGKKLNNLIQN